MQKDINGYRAFKVSAVLGMFYWTPSAKTIESWEPIGGWNNSFSEKDKIYCTNLFFFFKNKKGFTNLAAETYSQMATYKRKFPSILYTDEQEQRLYSTLVRR